MSSIDFDSVTETAAALFEQALERGPGSSEEFYRAWDKGLGDVRHRYPARWRRLSPSAPAWRSDLECAEKPRLTPRTAGDPRRRQVPSNGRKTSERRGKLW